MPPKSSPVDFIPTSIIKNCSLTFSAIIARLANLSFSEGIFPASFKVASVTPLLKKPSLDSANVANFRPISNLNNISKMLERLFLARLQPHVIESHNFNPLQSAYRPLHSTETSLLFTLNNIFTASDSGRPTVLVALDLSAAFDTIDHGILLNRLSSSFGIGGPAISWLHSYLTGRSSKFASPGRHQMHNRYLPGSPGLCAWPITFFSLRLTLWSADHLHGIMHQQYADDTQLYLSLTAPELRNSIQTLQNCLSQLQTWLCLNGLSLNAEKSEVILFGTRQRLCSFPAFDSIIIDGINVPVSDSLKTLGVTLDSHLTMDKHVLTVSRACNFHLRALRLIRPALTLEMASSIASSLIHSRLDYPNAVLLGISNKNLNKLQHLQNSLARTVLQEFRVRQSYFFTTYIGYQFVSVLTSSLLV